MALVLALAVLLPLPSLSLPLHSPPSRSRARHLQNPPPSANPLRLLATAPMSASEDSRDSVSLPPPPEQDFSTADTPEPSSYCVYILRNTQSARTYVGMTNNPPRRIRQHNGELVGGARYTRAFRGGTGGEGRWEYHVRAVGLTKREALSLERSVKNVRRRPPGVKTPLEHRERALERFVGRYPACAVVRVGDESG
ncbi:hypothetical protein B484DRAFT_426752 [Ochromonadaceae sp. CCMP2298]|nr:hypothetical protein B484DRAFT_430299 [Ochromonadaceae sp. CCMP2298]KAJ1442684.1 hypothetical protein B484DRAFT_426752 [Ochromonadaceae sp. CCMP2298]